MSHNPLGIRRIDHVSWTVAELEPVIAFYERVFGAQVAYRIGPFAASDLPRMPDGRDWTEAHVNVPGAHLELALLTLPGGARIELFRYTQPASLMAAPVPSNHVGSHHLGLEVDDLDAAVALLKANGCTVFERIAFDEGPTAGSKFQYFLDPWKNIFELVTHPARTTP